MGVATQVAGQALDPGYLRHLQNLVSVCGIESHVIWKIGYVHSTQIGLFHAAADLVLFPYREISQSAAFLTAAALGSFTLTTDVGGLAEIVRDGETGIQISSTDPEGLTLGLQRCIELPLPDRQRVGHALRTYVQKNYNWDSIAEKTVAVYRSITGDSQRSA